VAIAAVSCTSLSAHKQFNLDILVAVSIRLCIDDRAVEQLVGSANDYPESSLASTETSATHLTIHLGQYGHQRCREKQNHGPGVQEPWISDSASSDCAFAEKRIEVAERTDDC
jgi:hypothetical protein